MTNSAGVANNTSATILAWFRCLNLMKSRSSPEYHAASTSSSGGCGKHRTLVWGLKWTLRGADSPLRLDEEEGKRRTGWRSGKSTMRPCSWIDEIAEPSLIDVMLLLV